MLQGNSSITKGDGLQKIHYMNELNLECKIRKKSEDCKTLELFPASKFNLVAPRL